MTKHREIECNLGTLDDGVVMIRAEADLGRDTPERLVVSIKDGLTLDAAYWDAGEGRWEVIQPGLLAEAAAQLCESIGE